MRPHPAHRMQLSLAEWAGQPIARQCSAGLPSCTGADDKPRLHKGQTGQVTANQLKRRTFQLMRVGRPSQPNGMQEWGPLGQKGRQSDIANRRLSRSGEWRVAFIKKKERARKPESERNHGHAIMPHDFGGEGD